MLVHHTVLYESFSGQRVKVFACLDIKRQLLVYDQFSQNVTSHAESCVQDAHYVLEEHVITLSMPQIKLIETMPLSTIDTSQSIGAYRDLVQGAYPPSRSNARTVQRISTLLLWVS